MNTNPSFIVGQYYEIPGRGAAMYKGWFGIMNKFQLSSNGREILLSRSQLNNISRSPVDPSVNPEIPMQPELPPFGGSRRKRKRRKTKRSKRKTRRNKRK